MRHLKRGRKLNRSSAHRIALFRNLACRLFAHERIITTVPKAKELRPFAEKLITLARRGAANLEAASKASGEEARAEKAKALHVRRLLMARLGGRKVVIVKDDEIDVVNKLLNEIGPRFHDRPGGYLRIIKRTERRLGDAAPTAYIELLPRSETTPTEKK